MARGEIVAVQANFDGVRVKTFPRIKVFRRCSRCGRRVLIAETFSDPTNRFMMFRCRRRLRRKQPLRAHRVRDGFARWLLGEDSERSAWYLAERPGIVRIR
jgi:hypothetical protein